MAVNVSQVKQLTNSNVKFEDLFSYNISEGESTQNRIRLVKVSGRNYIAFSRYFLQKESNTYLPSKKHFFLPAELWPSIRAGLKLLNSILKTEAKKNESAALKKGSVGAGRPGFVNQSNVLSGKRFILPFDGPNCGITSSSSTLHASVASSIIPAQNIQQSTPLAPTFSFRALPSKSSFAYKRNRGRPPKAIPLEPLNFQNRSSHPPEASNIPVFISRFGPKSPKLAEDDATRSEAQTRKTPEDCFTIADIVLE